MRRILISLLLAGASLAYKVDYRYLGRISQSQPAFVKVNNFPGQSPSLFVSQFGVLGSGQVSVIKDIAAKVASKDFKSIKSEEIASGFAWPNEVAVVPPEVFGPDVNALVVPDGFLVPFHNNGNVFVITVDPADIGKMTQKYQLTAKKSGYFYHTGVWLDMNGDGRLDFVTARSNAKADEGELIWLEHPAQGLAATPWAEHLIAKSPDVQFEVIELPQYPDSYIIFTAEFFSHKLQVYQVSKNGGKVLRQRLIDDSIDQVYSVRYLDLDGDGSAELLVNNHEQDNAKAGVFSYGVPTDLFAGDFPRSTVATGFKNAWSLTVPNICPGFPYAVRPDGKEGPHHILVAGDGDYSAHLISPAADGYQMDLVKNLGGTVGSMAYADLDNDGWLEFFVPNYDKGYIEVYQFFDGDANTFLSE